MGVGEGLTATVKVGFGVLVKEKKLPTTVITTPNKEEPDHPIRWAAFDVTFPPGQDVPIKITGLRPGERLFERLFNDHEAVRKTAHPMVLRAAETNGDGGAHKAEEFQKLMDRIQHAAGESLAVELRKVAGEVERVCA